MILPLLWHGTKIAGGWLWGVLRSIPWQAWAILAAVVLAWAAIDRYGDRREAEGATRVYGEWEASLAEAAEESRRLVDAARKRETRARAAYAAAVEKLQQEKRDALAERDAVLADAAAGRLRLRDKFRCPAVGGGVPAAAAGPGGGDAAGGSILSREDQEFLVRIGAEADDLARRLTACQRILATDREENP